MGRGKGKFTETIRARVPEDLTTRIDRILEKLTHKDQSDFVRDAIAEYVTKEEERLGLTAPQTPPAKKKPVTYRKKPNP